VSIFARLLRFVIALALVVAPWHAPATMARAALVLAGVEIPLCEPDGGKAMAVHACDACLLCQAVALAGESPAETPVQAVWSIGTYEVSGPLVRSVKRYAGHPARGPPVG
jgi:hypothetical protein